MRYKSFELLNGLGLKGLDLFDPHSCDFRDRFQGHILMKHVEGNLSFSTSRTPGLSSLLSHSFDLCHMFH
jgi:hypothetical protein